LEKEGKLIGLANKESGEVLTEKGLINQKI
jgi:hypothetical protein